MTQITKFLTILLLSSCSTGHIVTTNLHNLANFEENSQIYTLPKTRVVVNLTVDKTVLTLGPYNKYAERFLQIKDARSISSYSYSITNISINTELIADPDYCYSIRNEKYGDLEPLLAEFKTKGLIIEENGLDNQFIDIGRGHVEKECAYFTTSR